MSENQPEITQVLAALAVSDLDTSTVWMRTVLGQAESDAPMEGLVTWSLGDAGVFQLVLDADRAGGSTVSFTVDDLASTHARLHDAGVVFDIEEAASGNFLLGVLEDPDGNSVTLVELKATAI